uniref:Uncharacterized protein n=1 Tax=Desertifilum tharense IPPAS B-1220 TaxID=1781255 RepID=A0ACD5GXI2_9CYAN
MKFHELYRNFTNSAGSPIYLTHLCQKTYQSVDRFLLGKNPKALKTQNPHLRVDARR